MNTALLLCHCPGEQPLQVARCTKIINADTDDPKYIINVKQFAKFVVDLSDQVAPTDIEEGMRVGLVALLHYKVLLLYNCTLLFSA